MSKLLRHASVSVVLGLIVSLATLLVSPDTASAQDAIRQIVVFGDSLSDTGNGFTLLNQAGLDPQSTPPDYGLSTLLVPSAPYARGGHHLTNGATWIEQLARPLGLARSVLPAFSSANPYATNFAISTARARNDGINPSLATLVSAFLQRTGGVAPADALYVIEVGGNDVRDAIAGTILGQNPLPVLQAAAAGIANAVNTLYLAGARNFLIWNVPDIGRTPALGILDAQFPGAAAGATSLSLLFNNVYLAAAVAPLFALPDINLVPFDAFALLTAIVSNPGTFGFTNVTSPCVMPGDPPFFCQNADDYFFWDGIHPTTAGHAIIAFTVAQLLGI